MNSKYLCLLFLFGVLNACTSPTQENTDSNEVNNPELATNTESKTEPIESVETFPMPEFGMKWEKINELYPTAEFIEVEAIKYGINGGGNGYDVIRNGEPLFFIWLDGAHEEISGILILNSNYIIDEKVHVGMNLNDFLAHYPNSKSFNNVLCNDECIWREKEGFMIAVKTTEQQRISKYRPYRGQEIFQKFIYTDIPIYRIFLDR